MHAAPSIRIALSGKMGSGKSTLGAAIASCLSTACPSTSDTRRTSFAGPIRAIIEELHGPNRTKDRDLLTGIGMLHRGFDPDTWLNAVRRQVARGSPTTNWVLDDLRFKNEMRGLRADGWFIVRLRVTDKERGRRLRCKYGDDATDAHHTRFAKHASETGLDDVPDEAFDLVVVVTDVPGVVCVKDPRTGVQTLIHTIPALAKYVVACAHRP